MAATSASVPTIHGILLLSSLLFMGRFLFSSRAAHRAGSQSVGCTARVEHTARARVDLGHRPGAGTLRTGEQGACVGCSRNTEVERGACLVRHGSRTAPLVRSPSRID